MTAARGSLDFSTRFEEHRVREPALADWLFGGAATRASIRAAFLLPVLLFLVGIVVVLLRLPDDARDLLWAEDGTVFLSDAYALPFSTNAMMPYAGYMHLFPRSMAELVSVLPIPAHRLGLAMNTAGAAGWSLAAVAAFVFSRGRVRRRFRVLLWAVTLLLPIGSFEVATNVANSHWFLMFGLFLAVSSRSGTTSRTTFALVLVGFAVLSDPLSLLVAPIVALRLLTLRTLREQVVSIGFAVAAAIQLVVVASTRLDRGDPAFEADPLVRAYLLRVVWQTLVGPRDGTVLLGVWGSRTVLSLSLAFLILLAAVALLRRRRAGWAVSALGFSGLFFLVVSVLTWETTGVPGPGSEVIWGGRYLVVPGLLLLLAVIVLLDAFLPAPARRTATATKAITVLVSLLLVAPGILNYQNADYRDGALQLSAGLAEVESGCESSPGSYVTVEIAPDGFLVQLPCRLVLEDDTIRD